MSVPSSPVNLQVRFTREALALLPSLTDTAIVQAIDRTVARLRSFQEGSVSPVPIDTGRLQGSFAAAASPRSLIMHWSAIDPISGYDYAKVQDIGRENMFGQFYSSQMRDLAHQWLVEELIVALQAIQAVVGP